MNQSNANRVDCPHDWNDFSRDVFSRDEFDKKAVSQHEFQRDAEVCQRLESFLKAQHFPAFRNLEIDVRDGAVTLSGQVSTFYEKQVAMTSCKRLAGVLSLVDQIEVADHLILGQV